MLSLAVAATTFLAAAEEAKAPLWFPPVVFPIAAAVVFFALGCVMFSFRDVANRHSHKVTTVTHEAPTDEFGHSPEH